MAPTIWKFALGDDIEMPAGAAIVQVSKQNGAPTLWAVVDPDAPTETRAFEVLGTGWPFPPAAAYVGTWFSEPFVWHVVEVPTPGAWQDWPSDNDGDIVQWRIAEQQGAE